MSRTTKKATDEYRMKRLLKEVEVLYKSDESFKLQLDFMICQVKENAARKVLQEVLGEKATIDNLEEVK